MAFFLFLAIGANAATINGVVRKLPDSSFVSGAKVVLITGTTRTDSVVTDSVGGYSLTNVATGNKSVAVTFTGFITQTNTVNITTTGQVSVSNFVLSLPGSISGKVRKSTDSTAINGATVYLRRTSGTSTIQDSVTADASGNFAFTNLTPGTPNYWVTATSANYVAGSNGNIVLASGAAVISNLYLAPVLPGSISGKVRKATDSTALAGAKLLLRRSNSDTSVVLDSAVSDVSGNYAFTNLVAGFTNYRIATTLSGYAAGSNTNITVNNGANTALNITLTALGRITGTVRKLSDSTSIKNALVLLRRGTSDTLVVLDSARTDSLGAYTFINLTASTGGGGGGATQYRVNASSAGYVSVTNSGITVTNGVTSTSNFFLGVTGTLSGKVRKSTDSTALVGASVYLRRTSGTTAVLDSTVSDGSGNYAFANVAPGTPNYWITASLANYVATTNSNVVVGSGAAVTSNLYLAPIMPGSISGKVRKVTDSTSIAGAKLLLRRGNADTSAVLDSAVSDVSGNYAFANLVAGFTNYRIATTAVGYAAGTNTNITVNNGANTALNISLTPLGRITGHVRKLSDSASIKNALVLLRRGTTDTSVVLDSARTDSLGAYTFINLTASTGGGGGGGGAATQYRVYATSAGFMPATNTAIVVTNGATTTSNFFLGLPGSLAGKVRKASDSTTVLKNASIYLRRTSATAAILDSAKTDSLGNYAFNNLAFGTPNYYITANLTGYVAGTNSNVVVGSGAAVTSNFYLALIVPGSISGKVRKAPDSAFVVKASVLLRRGASDTTAVLDSTKTDSLGNYAFNNLTPLLTDYRVTVSATGLVSATNANITVPNGGVATSNFLLVAPGGLAGRVRRLSDSTGLRNALVLMRRGNSTSAVLDSARTDSLGNFAFANLAPANNYRLTASFTGYTAASNTNITVASSAVTTSNFFLSLTPRGRILGKVAKATDSTALGNALLVLRRGSDTAAVVDSLRSDSTGRFLFLDVVAGTPNYWLTATRTGYASQVLGNIAVISNDTTDANFFLSLPVGVLTERMVGRLGLTAERMGNLWLIRMPTADKTRAFKVVDIRGAQRYQAVVPAGVDRIYVPGEFMTPGAMLQLR